MHTYFAFTHIYNRVLSPIGITLFLLALSLHVSLGADARVADRLVDDDSLYVSRRMKMEERREELRAKIDSAVTANYYIVNYDTLYIIRPKEAWMLKARVNVSGSVITVKQRTDDNVGRGKLRSNYKATVSLGVNYRGITAGLAFNPAMFSGKERDFELNVNTYSNRYGLDVVYLRSKSLSGNTSLGSDRVFVEEGGVLMKMLNVNGYYAFNNRRFSYPAAFSQSYVQRRSAGSWLVGFSYLGGSMRTTAAKPAEMPDMRVYLGHFAVGAGYGYNWKVSKRMLLHVSALPTLVVLNRNNIELDGEKEKMQTDFPDAILTERVAIVYALDKKNFIGGTFVMNNSLMGDRNLDMDYSKWRARLFWGMRF